MNKYSKFKVNNFNREMDLIKKIDANTDKGVMTKAPLFFEKWSKNNQ